MPSDTYILTISDAGVSVPSSHASTHISGGSDAIPTATSTTSGLMSAAIFNQHVTNTAKVSNVTHTGDVTDAAGVLTVNKINGVSMAGLATGIVKNTTSTGVPSIAVAADFPTLNQSTTGNAATSTLATTATNIAGGATGAVPYQTANNSTAMLMSGASGTVLKSNGAAAPSWSAVEKSMLSTALSNEITANTAKVSNATHTGDVTDTAGVLKVTKVNNVSLAGLATGILKNTTSTGEPSIAAAADFPTLNQSTTGNAATASNLTGGAVGSLPYQTANNSTTMLASGTAGTVLKSNGAAAPSWSAVEKSMLSTALSNEITANTAKVSNVTHTGDVTDTAGVLKVTKVNNVSLAGLATGILKNTTSTGEPSIAVAADFPTLNQSTTGNAATATSAISATSATTATTTTNIAGGNVGSIPYQSAVGTTTLLAAASSGFLRANGLAAPSWATLSVSDLSGVLPATSGGTGFSSYTVGDIVFANTNTTLSKLSSIGTGNVLLSGSVSGAPSYGKVNLTTTVSGVLPVSNGGTGLSTITGYVKGTGTGALSTSSTIPTSDLSGVIDVVNGGTGASTSTGTGANVLSTSPTLVTPILGTPISGTLTNCIGLPLTTGVTGILTATNGGTGATTSTGSGANVLATSPTLSSPILSSPALVSPALGTPTSGTLTSCTSLPLTTGVTGVLPVANGGTGVTAASTGSGGVVLSTSPTLVTPLLGTPTSGTLTNCTDLPISGLVGSTSTALGVGSIELGHATDTTISRVSAGRIAVEGVNVVTASSTDTLTNKTLVNPILGTPTSGTLTSCTGLPLTTGVTDVLPVANGGTGVTQSAYGECYISSIATTTIASTGVFVKVAGTTTAGTLSNFTHTNGNRLTYTGTATRKFLVTAALSFHGTSTNDYKFAFNKNVSTILTPSTVSTTGMGAGNLAHVSCQTIVELTTNDYIEVHVTNADATNNATIDFMNMVAVAII